MSGQDSRTLDPESLGDHIDRLYRSAWALCGSRAEAEDLVQETFAKVLAKPRRIHNEDDLGYLLQVLRNTFFSSRRAAARRIAPGPMPENLDLADHSSATRPEMAAETNEVFTVIAGLADVHRDALVAVDIAGLSYAEAAKQLGTKEATITSRLFRARAQVARGMESPDLGVREIQGLVMDREAEITEEEQARAQLGAVLIAAAVRETAAPQSLREAIERERARAASRPPARRRFGRLVLGPAGAGVLVAAVVAFAAFGEFTSTHDPEGGKEPGDDRQVASLSQLPAGAAPVADGGRLNVSVEGISFPNWTDVKWRASGKRSDSLLGHRVTTVFYTSLRPGATGLLDRRRFAAGRLACRARRPSRRRPLPRGAVRRPHHRGVDAAQPHVCHQCAVAVPYDKLVTLAAIEST